MRFIYSFLVFLASLVVFPISLIFDPPGPDGRSAWRERLGRFPPLPPPAGKRVWIQAVSVGEVQIARRLMEKMRSAQPDLEVFLTSTTPAGRRLAATLSSGLTRVSAFPLDLPFCVSQAIRRARPDAVILMETEIWPNLIRACSRGGVKVLIANGRISARTFPRYRWFAGAMRTLLARVDRFCMRSEEDARRIAALGAPADKVEVTGDLKWDLPAPGAPAADLRLELGLEPEAPVLVAGSTFQGEEAAVLDAWEALRAEFPSLGLLLAPRHPARFEEVAGFLAARGVAFFRRSGQGGRAESAVLLLDTVGELRRAYGAGTICFVGGSLVPRGGQNILEPAAAGRPVLFGPRTENFAEAAQALLQAGAGFRIESAQELLPAVLDLLRNPERCEEAGRRGSVLLAGRRGAAARTAGRILALLGPRGA